MVFGQGSFINSAATTPEELARKRAEIAAMMPRFGNARYVGEGLGQLFMGIGLGRQQKALDGQEREGRASAQERLNAVMGGGLQGRAQPGGFSVLGTMPMDPVAAPDPSSPEGIASDAMAVLGRASYTPGDKDSFVAAMMPHALRVSQETGLDPRLVIAQAAQETGWGKSAPNNNFFGIKSHGKSGGGTFATTEFVNGQPIMINDSFRGYGSMGESAADYARFLQENPRYRDMLSAPDLQGQIAALGASGYATDPNYANSVASIANSIQIPGMDSAPVGGMNSPQMTAATIPTDALMSIVMDQWQPPEVRAQAQAMLDQQMKMNDPAYTMGLQADELAIQKAEAELDAIRNPAPTARTRIVTGEDAAALGLDPALRYNLTEGPDGVEASVIGGGGTTIVNDLTPDAPELGKLSADYMYDVNPDGTPKRDANGRPIAIPVPGSPAAVEAERTRAAAERREVAKITEADVIITAAQRAREAADNRDFGSTGSGLVGWLFPQSDSAEVIRQVNTLKSNGTFSALQQMRENSPTGAALGAASDRDLQLLAEKAGALDPSSPNIQRDLDDYERTLLRTLYGPEEGDRIFAESRQGATMDDADAELFRKYGIQP